MTDEELLQILRDYNNNVGFPTVRKFKSTNGLPSSGTYKNRFGSFSKALELAGVEIPEERKKDFGRVELSDGELLSGLKKFTEETLQTQLTLPSCNQIALCPYIQSDSTYAARFGSVDIAYSLIGYNREEFNNKRLEDDMLKKYMEIYETLGRTPNSRDIDRFSKDNPYYYSASTYINHFGNIMDLQRICKLSLTKASQRKTKKDLLDDLVWLSEEIERTPFQQDLIQCPLVAKPNKYVRVFGSFKQAIIEAGLEPNSKTYITKQGNKCLSYLEYKFTKILENYNIPFQKEVYYKTVISNFDRQYRFDYVVEMNKEKYYIEIFGITGNEKYEIRKNEKIQLCKDNNIPLITFDFNDFWSNTNEQIYELLLHEIQEDKSQK